MHKFATCGVFVITMLTGCSLSDEACHLNSLECKLVNESPILQYSTDIRLMRGIKELGKLENGMAIHTWFWNKDAKKLDPKYNDPKFGGGIDSNSLTAVGLLTSEIKKYYPEAVFVRTDGFEQINQHVLMQKDGFIKNLIEAKSLNRFSSCTEIVGTRFRLCF